MSQTNAPNQTEGPRRGGLASAAVIGLILVALVSLAFAGYVALNPSTSTVTQQQFVTNTQTVTSLQTQTVNVLSTSTSVTTVTSSQAGIPPYGYGNYYYQTCDYYGCYYQSPGYYSNPGYYYGYSYPPACQNTGSGNNVSCSGYLYQADNGCTLLAIYTANNPYPSYATTGVYEYFTLHNLPSIAPSTGSYVTVTGQLYQGYNTASNGASCPTDYINVSSIS